MSKKQIDIYRTGIYLRLSQGDEDIDGLEKKESNSISNQKLLLEGFIGANDDLKLVDIFIDDGYSGSNFDRPEFQRMMASMKAGKLDCIIVKDLSRLARERIGADELIQKTFKKYNVRFIAVSEGYDSLTASSSETHTIIPFKNLLNEQYKVSGYMYVMDADIERRHPDKIIGDILEKEKMLRRDYGRGYKKFGAETVQFQWFLKEELAKASAKAGLYLPIEEVPQTSDKTMRIQTMQPDVKNHYIKFNKRHKRLLEQMEHFPMGAHDDGVDALEGCRTIAKKMKRFRVLDKGKLGL